MGRYLFRDSGAIPTTFLDWFRRTPYAIPCNVMQRNAIRRMTAARSRCPTEPSKCPESKKLIASFARLARVLLELLCDCHGERKGNYRNLASCLIGRCRSNDVDLALFRVTLESDVSCFPPTLTVNLSRPGGRRVTPRRLMWLSSLNHYSPPYLPAETFSPTNCYLANLDTPCRDDDA